MTLVRAIVRGDRFERIGTTVASNRIWPWRGSPSAPANRPVRSISLREIEHYVYGGDVLCTLPRLPSRRASYVN